jgi:hypothetical protein
MTISETTNDIGNGKIKCKMNTIAIEINNQIR